MSGGGGAGRSALITGGSGGIGLAIARVLGQEGYGLTLASRRPRRLAAAVEALRSEGIAAEGAAVDVADEAGVAVTIKQHAGLHGGLDVLVNNAGAGAVQPIEEVRTRLLDRIVATNLRGVVLCTREALPLLRAAGEAHGKALLVNVASLGARAGSAEIAVYAATKAGAVAFTRSTQLALGRAGVQCTALAPGLVDTPMADYARERMRGEEMIRPADVGESVRFLLRTSANCLIPEIVLTHPGGDAAAG